MTELWVIAAVSDNNVIGHRNALPWRIPEDLAHFKALTMGGTLLMGRKTYQSIGRPLPGRTTIVITRRPGFAAEGVTIARTPEAAIGMVRDKQAFVVGGAAIYAHFLPAASKLFLTRVHGTFDGDTYFPPFNAEDWLLVSTKRGTSVSGGPPFTFEIYERREPEEAA
jgi:dihydrofolate reductase